jgi:phage portal protein BeeE
VRLAVDTDALDALASDRAALWARVNAAAFLTLNEKRAMVGFGPAEGGDGVG